MANFVAFLKQRWDLVVLIAARRVPEVVEIRDSYVASARVPPLLPPHPTPRHPPTHHEAGGGRLGEFPPLRELAARSPCKRSLPRSARLLRIASYWRCWLARALQVGWGAGFNLEEKATRLEVGQSMVSEGRLSWPARLEDVVEHLEANLSDDLLVRLQLHGEVGTSSCRFALLVE